MAFVLLTRRRKRAASSVTWCLVLRCSPFFPDVEPYVWYLTAKIKPQDFTVLNLFYLSFAGGGLHFTEKKPICLLDQKIKDSFPTFWRTTSAELKPATLHGSEAVMFSEIATLDFNACGIVKFDPGKTSKYHHQIKDFLARWSLLM